MHVVNARRWAWPLFALVAILGAGPSAEEDGAVPIVRPKAKAQTDPVPGRGDTADDPAFWVHPTDPALSLVLGTNKKGGLHVYDLDGRSLQLVSDGCEPNNVDVLYGIRLGGHQVDLAIASVRKEGARGVRAWVIDPASRRLSELGDGPAFQPFGGGEPYGLCTYRSPKDGRSYVFVTDKVGTVEQYRVEGSDDGSLRASKVRTLRVGSQVEGCVADRELGRLYVGEEDVGIWRYGAEPDDGEARESVAKVGKGGLSADVEGLTIYYASEGRGYLIASSQGNNTFQVYERGGRNAHILSIDPEAGDFPDVSDTDGIDVLNVPTSSRFPLGVFVVQDGARQNFRYYAWEEIAEGRLIVDTRPSPREKVPVSSHR